MCVYTLMDVYTLMGVFVLKSYLLGFKMVIGNFSSFFDVIQNILYFVLVSYKKFPWLVIL